MPVNNLCEEWNNNNTSVKYRLKTDFSVVWNWRMILIDSVCLYTLAATQRNNYTSFLPILLGSIIIHFETWAIANEAQNQNHRRHREEITCTDHINHFMKNRFCFNTLLCWPCTSYTSVSFVPADVFYRCCAALASNWLNCKSNLKYASEFDSLEWILLIDVESFRSDSMYSSNKIIPCSHAYTYDVPFKYMQMNCNV